MLTKTKTTAMVLAAAMIALAGCGGGASNHQAQTSEDQKLAAEALEEQKTSEPKEQAEAHETQKREAKEAAATKKREAQEHREQAQQAHEEAHEQKEEQARASEPQTVPDESGQRLDVVEEELEAHSWHFKVVGGGVFGVVVPSHWTVCETRPAGGTSAPTSTTIRLIVARECP